MSRTPSLRAALISIVLVLASLAAPAVAAARAHSPQPHLRLVVSHRATKAGFVRVSATARVRARKVVFRVDGRHVWTAKRRPYRYHGSGLLDTRQLRAGVHVLSAKLYYGQRKVKTAKLRYVVKRVAKAASTGIGTGTRSAAGGTTAPKFVSKVGFFAPPVSGINGPSVAMFNRETFQYSSSLSVAQEAQRYQELVLQYSDRSLVPALKAANPSLKVLVYQDISMGRPGDPAGWSVCSNWGDVQSNHPDWLVRDPSGNPISNREYAGNYIMNVGNPEYQQACASHAIALAQQGGFDGVYLDDVSANISWYNPGVQDATYPTATAWQGAMTSMLSSIVPALHAQNLVAFGNIGGATAYPSADLWERWSAMLDGSEEQSWNNVRDQSLATRLAAWPAMLKEVQWSEAHGKYTILQANDSGESQNVFGLASMMLVADGKTSYATSNLNLAADEEWFGEYNAAISLGAPAGDYKVLSNGVYERAFAHGVVLVNPANRAVSSFPLGTTYRAAVSGRPVTSVSLGPQSAEILSTID